MHSSDNDSLSDAHEAALRGLWLSAQAALGELRSRLGPDFDRILIRGEETSRGSKMISLLRADNTFSTIPYPDDLEVSHGPLWALIWIGAKHAFLAFNVDLITFAPYGGSLHGPHIEVSFCFRIPTANPIPSKVYIPDGLGKLPDFELIAEPAGEREIMIGNALLVAIRYLGEEPHHNAWVIDQMVRALTGCPSLDGGFGESEQYLALVREARGGEDGSETYDWNEGIAP